MLDAETAVSLARKANDRLAAGNLPHPQRFAGFAELPTPDPYAAAVELERTVTQYNFKGALISGHTGGVFLDRQTVPRPFSSARRRSMFRFTCIRKAVAPAASLKPIFRLSAR